MGEARARRISRKEMLSNEPRCIYCCEPGLTEEHMPPIEMFRSKDRPRGMEFASCFACNNGTRAADTVASFVARMNPNGDTTGWEFDELKEKVRLVRMHAPGVLEEIFDDTVSQIEWIKDLSGNLKPMRTAKVEGPLLKAHLSVFASKVGMGIFREHAKHALPLDGLVFSQWFLNYGLPQQAAEAMMTMLPAFSTLKQGKKEAGTQFGYRFNTDESTTVAALCAFHSGLYTFTIATNLPEVTAFLTGPDIPRLGTEAIVRPGELIKLLPVPVTPPAAAP